MLQKCTLVLTLLKSTLCVFHSLNCFYESPDGIPVHRSCGCGICSSRASSGVILQAAHTLSLEEVRWHVQQSSQAIREKTSWLAQPYSSVSPYFCNCIHQFTQILLFIISHGKSCLVFLIFMFYPFNPCLLLCCFFFFF